MVAALGLFLESGKAFSSLLTSTSVGNPTDYCNSMYFVYRRYSRNLLPGPPWIIKSGSVQFRPCCILFTGCNLKSLYSICRPKPILGWMQATGTSPIPTSPADAVSSQNNHGTGI